MKHNRRIPKKYHRFTYEDLETIIDTMPQDEQTTLALDFYNYSDAVADEIEAFQLDFRGRKRKPLQLRGSHHINFTDYVDDDFESFDDEDDDFDNVVTDVLLG